MSLSLCFEKQIGNYLSGVASRSYNHQLNYVLMAVEDPAPRLTWHIWTGILSPLN
jgi:hypothetical protein